MADVRSERTERYLFSLAVALGIFSVALVAGAAQLWDYPYPRGLLIYGAIYAAIATLGWFFQWAAVRDGSPFGMLRWTALVVTVAAFSLLGGPLGALAECSKPDQALCSLKSDNVVPADAVAISMGIDRARILMFWHLARLF